MRARTGLSFLILLLALSMLRTPLATQAQDDFSRLKAQGVAFYQRGEIEKAKEFFIRAARIRQEAEIYRYLADIFRRQGDGEYADKLAEKARQLEQPGTGTTTTATDKTPPLIEINASQLKREMLVAGQPSGKIRVTGRAIDPSGIRGVQVGEIPASVDADGNFTADVGLKPGENRLLVVATDTFGNRAEKELTISDKATADAPPSTPPPVATVTLENPGAYHALVIGINKYKNEGLPELLTAEPDAIEVGRLLRDQYGFEVRQLLNATRREIMMAMSDYRKRLEENSNLLIYYAGHGYFDKPAEKGYWLPLDAEKDNQANWISADDLTTAIRAIRARHILIVADSCYSGTLTRNIAGRLGVPADRARMLRRMFESHSRTIMASGGNEPVADSGGGKHSVFAAAFLRALTKIDEPVFTADELFLGYIRQQVAGRADQKPQYDTIRNSGHDEGEFVFVRRKK